MAEVVDQSHGPSEFAAEQRAAHAARRGRASKEEALLKESLDGPQRLGGRRSRGLHEMPFEGRTAGIYVPEWLRDRLLQWARDRYPKLATRKPKIRALLLLAVYEVTKEFRSPDAEAKAISALEADPDFLERPRARRPKEPVDPPREEAG